MPVKMSKFDVWPGNISSNDVIVNQSKNNPFTITQNKESGREY